MDTLMHSQSSPSAKTHALPAERDRPVLAGILTGQIAGLIMAVVVMFVFTVFLGKSPLYPVQVIGSIWFGEAALNGFQWKALLAGLILHQAGPSLLWGAIYGLAARRFQPDTKGESLRLGLILGVISMTGPYLLIPFLMNLMQGTDIWNREVPMFWDWAAHLVFGASFMLYPAVRAKLGSQ